MDKKKQIILFLVIFSIIVLFFSLTSINPNVGNLYEKLFDTTDIAANEGLNLFLQPFTGMISFFVILLSIAASVLFTIIFIIVFPFITARNLSSNDGNLVYYIGSKVKWFCIVMIIIVAIVGTIYTNPFLAVLVILVYVLPMYIAYYVSNKLFFTYNLRKIRIAQEYQWAEEISEQNIFENRYQENARYGSMGYNQNRNHRNSANRKSDYK